MAVALGRVGKVYIGTTKVGYTEDYNFNLNREEITVFTHGDDYERVVGVGPLKSAGSISGVIDDGDTLGQNLLFAAVENGTSVSGLKIYRNATSYWQSDTDTDSTATAYISTWEESMPVENKIGFTCNFRFDGPVELI